jgi:hypothetical protein
MAFYDVQYSGVEEHSLERERVCWVHVHTSVPGSWSSITVSTKDLEDARQRITIINYCVFFIDKM